MKTTDTQIASSKRTGTGSLQEELNLLIGTPHINLISMMLMYSISISEFQGESEIQSDRPWGIIFVPDGIIPIRW